MAVKVEVDYSKQVSSAKPLEETFAYCADLQRAVGDNFPGVEKIEPVDPSTYRWEFEKIGYSGYDLQIILLTRVTPVPSKSIEMVSLPGKEMTRIQGRWLFTPEGPLTQISFSAKLELDLPIPFFLKAMAGPVAQKELSKLFDRFLTNVSAALSK